jgi:hypothetical protein
MSFNAPPETYNNHDNISLKSITTLQIRPFISHSLQVYPSVCGIGQRGADNDSL